MAYKYKTLRGLQRAISSGKEIAPDSITKDLVIETIKKEKDITFIPSLCERMYSPPRDVDAFIVAKGYVRQIFLMYYCQNTYGVEYSSIKFSPAYTATLLRKLQPYVSDGIIKQHIRIFKMKEEMCEDYAVLKGYLEENRKSKFIGKLEDKLRQL